MPITTSSATVEEKIFEVIVEGGLSGYLQQVRNGKHEFAVDEPVEKRGTDRGPSPYALLMASLGACTSMTIAYHAQREKFPIESIVVKLSHRKINRADCPECSSKEGRVDVFEREIEVRGTLTEQQRQQVISFAERCPVHRTLTSGSVVRTTLAQCVLFSERHGYGFCRLRQAAL